MQNILKKPESGLGLREQNKLEKVQRIRAAARELFAERGYDAATLREIAARAHVGLGTLFNYAEDKRDLVFLIFNEELEAITDEALSAPRPHGPLVDNLIAIFRPHYKNFSRHPVLSRILLKELVFYSEGKHAARFQKTRRRLLSGIEEVVRAAQEAKQISSGEDAAIIARHVFFTYSAEIRWWIANPTPQPSAGVADLSRLLGLQISGLRPLEAQRTLGTAVGAGARASANRKARTGRVQEKRSARAGH